MFFHRAAENDVQEAKVSPASSCFFYITWNLIIRVSLLLCFFFSEKRWISLNKNSNWLILHCDHNILIVMSNIIMRRNSEHVKLFMGKSLIYILYTFCYWQQILDVRDWWMWCTLKCFSILALYIACTLSLLMCPGTDLLTLGTNLLHVKCVSISSEVITASQVL